ncbi:MAG: MJ1255/VC2487 family glycosyltransferase [Candidatus Woesearchaeota archaeon]
MVTIFYGVGGEGMGHATRSEAVIQHLLSKRHKVVIFSYERAFDYLSEVFKDSVQVVRITGINFVYEKNEFKIGKTIIRESKKIPPLILENFSIFLDYALKFKPSLIITDLEMTANYAAKLLGIPLICIDNINFMAKCQIDKQLENSIVLRLGSFLLNFQGEYNFILTVFDVPLKEKYRKNCSLVGPVIRSCFSRAGDKDYVMVYQTSKSNRKLFSVLKRSKERFVVYGFNKEGKSGNITFKKPSRDGFARDLMECKALITNGGFTLISEAAVAGKPIYSIPVKNQVEQVINGYYVEKSGFGVCSEEINNNDLDKFLGNLEKYRGNLANGKFKRNDLFELLDKRIAILSKKYKVPRVMVLDKIKDRYDEAVMQFLETIDLREKAKVWVSSVSYTKLKEKFLARLQVGSRRVEEIANELGIVEKRLKMKNCWLTYGVYHSNFNSRRCLNLVCLHGLGGNKSVFVYLIDELIKVSKKRVDFRVVMIDSMGHGKSASSGDLEDYAFGVQSRNIARIVEREFGTSDVAIVGHCYGSFLGISFAQLLKKRVTHLFLISSYPFGSKSDLLRLKMVNNQIVRSVIRWLFRMASVKKSFYDFDYSGFRKSGDYDFTRLYQDIKCTGIKGYTGTVAMFPIDNVHETFNKLELSNVVLVHGRRDGVFPYKDLEKHANTDGVKVIGVDSNHLPVLNANRELAEIILKNC